jgi:hypothetical protein
MADAFERCFLSFAFLKELIKAPISHYKDEQKKCLRNLFIKRDTVAVVSSLDCCLMARLIHERVRFHRRQIDFFLKIL